MGDTYSDVIDRMKLGGKLKNDSAVARVLGVTSQALSHFKKRGKMPTHLVVKFAILYHLSVDWLLTDDGKINIKIYDKKEIIYSNMAKEILGCGRGTSDFKTFNKEEIAYIAKLLKLLCESNNNIVVAIKYFLDAIE